MSQSLQRRLLERTKQREVVNKLFQEYSDECFDKADQGLTSYMFHLNEMKYDLKVLELLTKMFTDQNLTVHVQKIGNGLARIKLDWKE